jgi:oligoribonuclease NrnB/cAMP/cGMP phosphodiesterase (DHH superfamily)
MKCFYHSADLDGHCSGAIVKFIYPECDMLGINYGQDFPWSEIGENEIVYMVDFSLQPFSDMEKLNQLCHLIWIDHHKTAIQDAIDSGTVFYGIQRDGIGACALVWEFLCDGEDTPNAVQLLAEYDVWDHSRTETLPFQYGMRFEENTTPENQDLWRPLFRDVFVGDIINTGETILKYEDRQNEKFCKAYSFETIMPAYPPSQDEIPPGYKAIACNRGFTNSKLFESVYDPKIHDMMVTFCRLKLPAHKWTVSMYSTKENVDCGAVAKAFGGGGHKGAAGFQCDELPFVY